MNLPKKSEILSPEDDKSTRQKMAYDAAELAKLKAAREAIIDGTRKTRLGMGDKSLQCGTSLNLILDNEPYYGI